MISRTDFTFFHPLRVRWSECDAQGIVFNVNYFLYFDIAVWEWTRALGYSKAEAPEFVTAHAEADYRRPAIFDDEIEIGARCARFGTKSMDVVFAAFRGDELLAEGRLSYVYVKKGTVATAPLPAEFVERVIAFEKTLPKTKS